MTPVKVGGLTEEVTKEWLDDKRDTHYKYTDEPAEAQFRRVADSWRDPAVGHARLDRDQEWTGSTIFHKRAAKHGQRIVGTILLSSGSEDMGSLEMELEAGEYVVASQEADANAEQVEEGVPDETELRRRKLLRQFLDNEHRTLGHSKTVELLYEGEALAVLKAIRAECKLCQEFDDAKAVLYRGSLLQFATGRNQIWLIDSMPSRIGTLIKVIDVCTRKRHTELVDASSWKGGMTGAAIRCFTNARHALNGAPETLVYDLGSNFLSQRFQRVVTAANTKGRPVGFKAAYKISKLERTNGDDRLLLNKLTNLPADQWMEIFLWGLSGHYEDQDGFEGGGWERTLERLVEQNQKPILGTQLSAENFHAGTFNRGARDWEIQLGELMQDHKIKDKEIDKLLVSESVFLAQVTFDMFLCRINRPLLSITDAKNLMQEPKERNLRPDYHTIAMLVRERLLVIAHGPGDRFWADGLTKEPRFGHLFLLRLCMNFGLVDRVMFGIIQTHIKRIVEVEDEQRMSRALDAEMEQMALSEKATTRQRQPPTVGTGTGYNTSFLAVLIDESCVCIPVPDPEEKIIGVKNADMLDSGPISTTLDKLEQDPSGAGSVRTGWTDIGTKWRFTHLPVPSSALFIPLEFPDRFVGGPSWVQLGVRRDTFYRRADQPADAPLQRYSDQW
eukprot:g19865.t1